MQTIKDYVKKYGKYTFKEEKFNEVDNVIFSLLSYVDWSDIVPGIKEGYITLNEACNLFYKKYTKKEIENNILAVKSTGFFLKDIMDTVRYKDLILSNYEYMTTFDMQFGALCITIPDDKSMYISFEGTDATLSGWKEDFMFSYQFPTDAQIEAVNYIDKVVGLFSPKIYIGGHSKGGNLALVGSMFCKFSARMKIKAVYSNDGPGLRKREFESKKYKKILPKLHSYIPKESIVGMLLRHSDNYIVIDSKSKIFMQHNAYSWLVEDNHFKSADLSNFSKKFEKSIISWLDKLDDNKRKQFIDSLFGIFKKAEINDLMEIRKTKINSMIKILKETKNLDKETKSMLLTCFKDFINEMKD